MNDKVVLGWAYLSIPEKIEKARHIVASMNNNAAFPTPSPALTQIADVIDALHTAYNNGSKLSRAQTALVKDKADLLGKLMKQLAAYVEVTANGNAAVILTAGMNIREINSSHPLTVHASNGNLHGEVKLTTAITPHAVYVWQVSPDPFVSDATEGATVSWKQLTISTLAKVVLPNFQPGVKYWFRVAPIVRNVQGDWSDPISLIVQ